MIKEFNNLEEIQKYYDKDTITYAFKEYGLYIDAVFNFDLELKANIIALNIKARNINVWNIDTLNINALNINANDIIAKNINAYNIISNNIYAKDINYYAVCYAYNNIECESIRGRRENSKHFVLDGKLEVEENE